AGSGSGGRGPRPPWGDRKRRSTEPPGLEVVVPEREERVAVHALDSRRVGVDLVAENRDDVPALLVQRLLQVPVRLVPLLRVRDALGLPERGCPTRVVPLGLADERRVRKERRDGLVLEGHGPAGDVEGRLRT